MTEDIEGKDLLTWIYESRRYLLAQEVLLIFGVVAIVIIARESMEPKDVLAVLYQLAAPVIMFYFGASKIAEAYQSTQELISRMYLNQNLISGESLSSLATYSARPSSEDSQVETVLKEETKEM